MAAVKDRVRREVAVRGITKPSLISARVTQAYDAGACVYFYFGFNFLDYQPPNEAASASFDPVAMYEEIEHAARDEILAAGGSLSHHHGVGKIRRHWMRNGALSNAGLDALRAVKRQLDPMNIFAVANLFDPNEDSTTTTTGNVDVKKQLPASKL